MSELRLVIRDAQREICGEAHGSFVECVIAALSAEPETIEELDLAMERFVAPQQGGHFRLFRPGANDQPHDSGIAVVDLAARVVACESSYCDPGSEGYVAYHDGESATDVSVRYHVSGDWEFTKDMNSWRGLADVRRRARRDNPPLEARPVLYGLPMLEFVARECLAAFGGRPALSENAAGAENDKDHDIVRQIHVKWMMTARDDLRSSAPRDVMLARHKFIDWNLQDRAEQWSLMLRPPPPLDPRSAAYRFGGFGTHEIVTYYDLLRGLIESCREFVARVPPTGEPAEPLIDTLTPRLAEWRESWLDRPDPDFGNRTPRELIHNERIRRPEACSGEDAVVDPDCPLCQLQADMAQPGFWHLDGSHMDDDFAFSFHRTRQQYQEEQREYEEFNRRWEAEEAERKRLGVTAPEGGWLDPDYAWESTFTDREASHSSAFMRLFAIGSSLCEIVVALKQPTPQRTLIDRLSRDYGNLREVVQGQDGQVAEALIQPVLERFCESLDAAAAGRPDLEARCSALRERLSRFTEPPAPSDDGPPDAGDGLP